MENENNKRVLETSNKTQKKRRQDVSINFPDEIDDDLRRELSSLSELEREKRMLEIYDQKEKEKELEKADGESFTRRLSLRDVKKSRHDALSKLKQRRDSLSHLENLTVNKDDDSHAEEGEIVSNVELSTSPSDKEAEWGNDFVNDGNTSFTFDELKKLQLTRDILFKWVREAYFEKFTPGFYVRVVVAQKDGKAIYRVTKIVDISKAKSSYMLPNKVSTSFNLVLKIAGSSKTREFSIINVSNSPFTEDEYNVHVEHSKKEGIPLTTKDEVSRKLEQLEEAKNYVPTEKEILSKVKAKPDQLNDFLKIEEQKRISLAMIDKKNRERNILLSTKIEAERKAHKSSVNPFERRKSTPTILVKPQENIYINPDEEEKADGKVFIKEEPISDVNDVNNKKQTNIRLEEEKVVHHTKSSSIWMQASLDLEFNLDI